MRIATVTAHYPPNFISGGTLVPHRIAEGFAARGHDVHVFAGSYQDGEPDMTVRTEITQSGVQIQWTTITGMLAWGDDVNFSNNELAAEFARWVAVVRPEVVHFHNMQGFGGSLVSVASAAGAVTVVTTHDMWWWCARQFLVDPKLRPCCTVVDCGVCPCEVDNAWLVDRNRQLAAHLRNADLVLAPSGAMIDLLSANGIDPARLALDENPAPATVRQSAPRAPFDGTVRFVFAGGKHPVKGGQLAIDAARELGDLDGWSLDLYGVQDAHRLPDRVTVLPPYAPDEVAEVLAGYDVLVMSSIMLESYSLLTREALAAGCAVITGDNPGPTEVVRDGVNGLVVPRGDAPALARAMRRMVAEPGLLHRLRPTPGALSLRSLDEQLDGLAAHYRELLAVRPGRSEGATETDRSEDATDIDRSGAAAKSGGTQSAGSQSAGSRSGGPTAVVAERPVLPPLRQVLIVSGITGAPLRYRGYLPQEALDSVGITADLHMYRDAAVPRKAREADAVIFYRVPATDQILDLIEMIRSRREPVPILFDVDDLIFDPGLRHELDPVLTKVPGMDLDLYWQGIRRYRTTLEAADAYIGSTEMLCNRVTELTGVPSHRFANGVGRQLAKVCDFELYRPRRPGPLRIGYLSGTNTHNEDWAYVEPAIAAVLAARPDVQLWIGGLLEYTKVLAPFKGRIRRLPLKPWHQLPAVLRDLDVNLAPLEPDKIFNEAKSAIKWLEAALTRTVTVASPSQPFREAIEHGRTGMLAADLAQWQEQLLTLLDDEPLRAAIGHAAREQALLTLSPARQGYRYREILETARAAVAREGHREQFDAWTPETLSEPYITQVADGYGPPPLDLVVGQGRRRRWAGAKTRSSGPATGSVAGLRRKVVDYRAGALTYLRAEGAAATARKVAAVTVRESRARAAQLGRRFR